MDESGTDEVEYSMKVESGRREASAIRCLVNAKSLQLSVLVLHETLLVPVLTYGNETMIWMEK